MRHSHRFDDRTDSEKTQEILDRTRRIETRFTNYLEKMGYDTESQKPRWKDGAVDLPAMGCSISDCLNTIPDDWPEEKAVAVYHKGKYVMVLYRDDA